VVVVVVVENGEGVKSKSPRLTDLMKSCVDRFIQN